MTTHALHLTSTDTAAVAVFPNHEDADSAVNRLASSGFDVTKVTVVGRGFHSEEQVVGFYTTGDRITFWGKYGAFWGGVWGLLFGGIFLTVPLVGPVIVAGHLAAILVAGVEGAVVAGSLSAIGAAFYQIGIPKADAIRYETAIKADNFLVVVHGTAADIYRAKVVLQKAGPVALDIHEHIDVHPLEGERRRRAT